MSTNDTWSWGTSTTRGPRRGTPRPTGSASGSTKPCSMNAIGSRFGRRSIGRWRGCRWISMRGWRSTPSHASGSLVLWQAPEADVSGECGGGEGENLSSLNPVRTRCLSDEVLTYTAFSISTHAFQRTLITTLTIDTLRILTADGWLMKFCLMWPQSSRYACHDMPITARHGHTWIPCLRIEAH